MTRNILLYLTCIVLLLNLGAFSNKSAKRGAKTRNELSNAVFQALKSNDFPSLTTYLVNDEELDYLRKNSSEKENFIYENLSGEKVKTMTSNNFSILQKLSVDRGISWPDAELTETSEKEMLGKPTQLIISIQDTKNKSMKISCEMVKVNGRYYLFTGMTEVSESTADK